MSTPPTPRVAKWASTRVRCIRRSGNRGRDAARSAAWISLLRAEILGVGDVRSPLRLRTLAGRFPHREVRHEMVRRGSVPVPLPRRRPDRVPLPDLDDLTTTGLHQA